MEFALHVEELILTFHIKIRNGWKRPDPSKKASNLRNAYLCITSPFKSTKEEADSITNLQEEVSRITMQIWRVITLFSLFIVQIKDTFGTIVFTKGLYIFQRFPL